MLNRITKMLYSSKPRILILGDYVEKGECLKQEYKQFMLKRHQINSILSKKEIATIFKTNKFTNKYQDVINMNIKDYIYRYIPKYTACFSNSGIDGCLTFGISDCREITGIPFIREPLISDIRIEISKVIKENIKSNYNSNFIIDNINIELEPLEIDFNYLEDPIDNLINQGIKYKNLYNNEVNQYIYNRNKWYIKLDRYRSLMLILNGEISRNELKKYIMDGHKDNKNKGKNIIIKMDKENIKKLPDYNTLQRCKVNKNSYFYWLVKFKDWRVEQILREKPIKKFNKQLRQNLKFQENCKPHMILSQLSNLRYRLLKNNSELKYYLIHFKINGSKLSKHDICYSNLGNSKEKWLFRSRIMYSDGPGCITN